MNNRIKWILIWCGAVLVLSETAWGDMPARQIVSLDYDWQFRLGDQAGWEMPDVSDGMWRTLDVPHDWSIESEYSPKNTPQNAWLPGGIGWYRKHFKVSAAWLKKTLFIQFDGVYMNSDVWVNGHHLGNRPYGYISFEYDMTPYLVAGENVVAVRCDNSLMPSSRWYSGSGIYGHVRLLMVPKIHFVPNGGIFIRTTDLSDKNKAVLKVGLEVNNQQAERTVEVSLRLKTPAGRVADESRVKLRAAAETVSQFEQQLTVKKPLWWSPDNPVLYHFEAEIINNGNVIDREEFDYGIRTLKWDSESGFWLNGSNTKLHGVCNHHDGGPVGAAIPDKLLEWRLKLLKKMGCNAIRTAHNPRTPIFYELCDRLGLLVMDEVFDGWRRKAAQDYGARFFKEWWRRDVTDWVRRDRNHACIFLYSIGNETGHTDINNITGLIHKLDDSRKVTGGTCFYGVDVAGFNGPGGTPGTLEKFRRENPGVPLIITEEPHTLQTRGFYRVPTWWRDKGRPRFDFEPYGTKQIFFDGNERYHSSYDNALVRMNIRYSLKRTETTPWLSGEFRWTGFDCLGEAQFMGTEFCKRIYNPGVIDLAGIPKDSYYLYQSQWTQEPMVHVLPHWTHPHLKTGTEIPVVAYSNCDEVELWLNGTSLGRKKPGELLDFVWKVPYQPGELKAMAYQNGQVAASQIVRTTGSPVALRLETSHRNLKPDRRDIALVTFSLVDERDDKVPWAMNRVEFKIDGPVKHLGFENGDPIDGTPHRVTYRKAFYGMGRGFFQATDQDGDVVVTAGAILGDTLFQDQTQVAIDVQRINLRGKSIPTSYQIYYTTDGSEPQAGSKLFQSPFVLFDTTEVRAVIMTDGREILRLKTLFVKGPERRVTDIRFSEDKEKNGAGGYKGPFDKELVGIWAERERRFEFRSDGVVIRLNPGPIQVGWWWYDFPNDTFEAAGDTGMGRLRWKSGDETPLKLAKDLQSVRVKNRTWKKE